MTLVTFRNRPMQQHSLEAREKFQPGRFPSRLFELPSSYSSSILPSNFCRNRARVVRREIARHYSSTLETRARIVNKREREKDVQPLTQSVLTRPLSDDDAQRDECFLHLLRSCRFLSKRKAQALLSCPRRNSPNCSLLILHLASNNLVLPPRCSSNVNKVVGACAVAGSFAANHTDLSARPHCPFPIILPSPPSPRLPRTLPPTLLSFLPSSERKNAAL